LRLFPQAIPLGLLKEFEPSLRQHVALRLGLKTRGQTRLVARDDGGPANRMWVYEGGAVIEEQFDEPGIVRRVRMDDAGFCNPEVDAYAAAKLDVAALGDSLTFCTTVRPEDTWPSVLQRRTGLRTYNFGVPARGPYEYLQILKTFALPKSPRVVVLDVYEGNDLRDAHRHHAARKDPRLSEVETLCPFRSSTVCDTLLAARHGAVGRHSYAINLLTAAPWFASAAARKGRIDFRYDLVFADGTVEPFNTENADRDEIAFARALFDGSIGLDLFDDALRTYVDLAAKHRFVPVVVYTPSAYTAYGARVRFHDPTVEPAVRFYSDAQRRYFAAKAEELGYRYLDLTPALQTAADRLGRDGLLYFRTNVHLTQKGHEVVAEEVAKLLRTFEESGR
jgi:lysophospholipase L1-like esterase